MFKRQQSSKRRSYSVKKRGIKDEHVDRQILVIHRAIGLKMLKLQSSGERDIASEVEQTLEQRRDEGRMGYGEFLTWSSLLLLLDKPDEFLGGLLEDTEQMRKYRRRTPLVGILTEEERQLALEENALGHIDDVSVLF